jgi:hypothetical protein
MTAPVGAGNTKAPWRVRWVVAGLVALIVLGAPTMAANLVRGAGRGAESFLCHLSPSACQDQKLHPELPDLPTSTTADYGPSYVGVRTP